MHIHTCRCIQQPQIKELCSDQLCTCSIRNASDTCTVLDLVIQVYWSSIFLHILVHHNHPILLNAHKFRFQRFAISFQIQTPCLQLKFQNLTVGLLFLKLMYMYCTYNLTSTNYIETKIRTTHNDVLHNSVPCIPINSSTPLQCTILVFLEPEKSELLATPVFAIHATQL